MNGKTNLNEIESSYSVHKVNQQNISKTILLLIQEQDSLAYIKDFMFVRKFLLKISQPELQTSQCKQSSITTMLTLSARLNLNYDY